MPYPAHGPRRRPPDVRQVVIIAVIPPSSPSPSPPLPATWQIPSSSGTSSSSSPPLPPPRRCRCFICNIVAVVPSPSNRARPRGCRSHRRRPPPLGTCLTPTDPALGNHRHSGGGGAHASPFASPPSPSTSLSPPDNGGSTRGEGDLAPIVPAARAARTRGARRRVPPPSPSMGKAPRRPRCCYCSQPTNPPIFLFARLIFQSRSYKFSTPNFHQQKKSS